MIRRRLALAGLLVTLFQQLPGAAFPRPSAHVNDFAQALTDDDREYLENFLRTLERDTTAEVVVVTVTSLDGMTIEEYANRLFEDWGIGTKTKDNGVLLLVAPGERKVRIEVGYGLEGSLPDGLAGEIIRTAILPEFKQGNLRRGIGRGLDRISRVVRGDAAAVTAVTSAPADAGSDIPPVILAVPFFGILVLLGGVAAGLALGTKTIALLIAAGLLTVIPLFIAATMSPWSLVFLLPVELIGMAVGYARGQSDYWWRTLRTGSPGGTTAGDPGTWVMGGSDSSSSSGSDSGSDSSSSSSSDFGGGSSGGGGASGSW